MECEREGRNFNGFSNFLKEDHRFLKELFENLKNPNLDENNRREMFQFLREFITFSHGLQQTREPLYKVRERMRRERGS